MRNRLPLRAILILATLIVASLLLIQPRMPVTLAQVGADARPKPTPKPSAPGPLPKRTTTRPPTNSSPHTAPQSAKRRQIGLPIEMVLVPAGTFMMGSPDGEGNDEEHPEH